MQSTLFWMAIMLLLGIIIGTQIMAKHTHYVLLFLILAVVVLVVLYVALGGSLPRIQG